MYLDYFGLKELPFSIAPDPRYLYMSERHREALAHLLYGVSGQGGFVVLTGEVGTGKTTICRCFLNQVPKNTDVAFIINPKLSARELMSSMCDELDIKHHDSASIKTLTDLINHYLLAAHADNRHTVLIIDEAQNLRVDVLEQLRLLTNLETSEKKLLQIILLGQPELRDILAQNELRQLAQRITARYHLHELTNMEVGAYVQCRLAVAGRRGRLFDNKSIKSLYKFSEGVPRLINLIADRALLGAYASQSDQIEVSHVKMAYREIQGERVKKNWFKGGSFIKFMPAFSLVGIIIIALFGINNFYANKMQTALEKSIEMTEPQISVEGPNQQDNNQDLQAVEVQAITKITESEQELSAGLTTTASVDDSKSAPILEQITGLSSKKTDRFQAYKAILSRWGTGNDFEPFMLACEYAEIYSLRCLHKNGNWRSLLKLNRPAVLNLINEVGETLYFALMAIDGDHALISHQSKQFWVALDEIDRYWLGEYSLLWRLPPYLANRIEPGQLKEAEWLRSSLLAINQSDRVGSGNLETEIKQFQLNTGLIPDGIVGSMTLIHLNSQLNLSCPKLLSGA